MKFFIFTFALFTTMSAFALDSSGKLLLTGGTSSLEGASGGGITRGHLLADTERKIRLVLMRFIQT